MDKLLGSIRPLGAEVRSRPDDIPGLSSLSLPDGNHAPAHCRTLFSPGPAVVHSPVTNLALDMNKLVGLGSQGDTPKRREYARLEKAPSFASDVSSDAGLGMESPSPIDILEMEDAFEKAIQQSSRVDQKMPLRRNNSLPLQLLCFSPSLKGSQTEANRYGIFGQQPGGEAASPTQWDNKENISKECFEFKKPIKPASRPRMRSFVSSRDAFAQRPGSAPALMLSSPLQSVEASPPFPRLSSLASSPDEDDGFLEALDDDSKNTADVPRGMADLLTAPLVADGFGEDSPVIRWRPRSLFRSPSAPGPSTSRACAKRPDCPDDDNMPMQIKRRRSLSGSRAEADDAAIVDSPATTRSPLQRSKSFCQSEIDRVLERNDETPDLIGDFTKPYALPTVDGKHQDLKYVTPETVAAVMKGDFSRVVEQLVIIDCRYPYEYNGGHIKGAVNLYLEDDVQDFLLRTPLAARPEKRVIVLFHCEFSSERGPRMCRFVRQKDRSLNDYPKLHYPELYVLKGGYKEFFPLFQTQCEPESYRPMMDEDFREDLRKFRLKSRSWAGERSKRDMYSRLKKL
ncbi:M-phase inducer phosphatase 2 [Corythoichthys intestinalis]|uniref:M-phase inducer phosphatase 2 n=1 Tax=Corythoichthys intestinalis TaxID=161448 RepID=UPI0025A53A94|nr:M-phase inducer phosphatase 2 [Corythoichthys intestinalis]